VTGLRRPLHTGGFQPEADGRIRNPLLLAIGYSSDDGACIHLGKCWESRNNPYKQEKKKCFAQSHSAS
jgi:hypothetical protein